MQQLAKKQSEIDANQDHAAKVDKAAIMFKNKTPKHLFDEVRLELDRHSPPGQACFYCERDRYRDIEHVWPKRHYPEKTFDWNNYVFACAICNQDKKRDKFAIFDQNGTVIIFDRTMPVGQLPPVGDPVMIDVRSEDPLDFLMMDLSTGLFVPIGVSARDIQRGNFTRDLFDLDNDTLSRIRRHAFASYLDWIGKYVRELNTNGQHEADRILREIEKLPFPTVLVEMRRQAQFMPKLAQLFDQLPDHIGARPS